MTEFTTGPWVVNDYCAQVDEEKTGLPVLRLLWPTDKRTEAETLSNAQLVAAAPDMYAALEHAAANMPHPDKMIDDALAKARGEL